MLNLSISIKLQISLYIWYCTEYGYCIDSENLGVLHRVHVLYLCIGPCNLSTKCQKTSSTVVKPIKFLCSTIFVLPDLGTDQGMSTKLGDQKISENLA